jgi:alkylhydroperoxidase/carboxymuconolactone decarboxylase family protein YurZ
MSCLSFSPEPEIRNGLKKKKKKFKYFLLRYRRAYAPPIPIHVYYLWHQSSTAKKSLSRKQKEIHYYKFANEI